MVSRREFLERTAAAAGLAAMNVPGLHGNPLGLPIGCQTYTVRESIGKDFPGTIKELAGIGFQSIELCSPAGYVSSGFGALAQYKPAEMKKIMNDAGVICVSSHFTMAELRKDLPARIAWAKEVGLKQMLVPSLDGPKNPTMDDLKRAADEYNKIAAQSAKAGLQQGLHNENFELAMVDGRRAYDILLELLDPKLVKFQFQCSTISRGYDAAEYLTKYPGRFFSMHVQDWSPETKKTVAVGQGVLDWKKIFTAARKSGLKNYYVEMNLEAMKASVPYLRDLKV